MPGARVVGALRYPARHAHARPFRRSTRRLRLEATLRAQASLTTYRRRYQPVPDLTGALRLLITDLAGPGPIPRALAFQLACLQGYLESLPRLVAGPFGNERALIREAGNAVSLADIACPSGSCDTEALRRLLEPVLSEVERLLRLCSDELTARYLADTYVPQRLLTASPTAPTASGPAQTPLAAPTRTTQSPIGPSDGTVSVAKPR